MNKPSFSSALGLQIRAGDAAALQIRPAGARRRDGEFAISAI
jgi:hypothetical protein